MAWPPIIPPATRADGTPQLGNHPDDHVKTSEALTEIVNAFGIVGRISSTLDFTAATTGGSPGRVEMGTTDYLHGGFATTNDMLVVPEDGVYVFSFIAAGKSALSHTISIAVRTGITSPGTAGAREGDISARGEMVDIAPLNTVGGCSGIGVLTAGTAVSAAALTDNAGKNISTRSLTVARIGPLN